MIIQIKNINRLTTVLYLDYRELGLLCTQITVYSDYSVLKLLCTQMTALYSDYCVVFRLLCTQITVLYSDYMYSDYHVVVCLILFLLSFLLLFFSPPPPLSVNADPGSAGEIFFFSHP